jgi:predicted RNase H-like HicB family nuclease
MTIEYAVVIERGPEGCSAYVPDLPGCVAAADTEEEVTTLIREAIKFHLEGMRENGEQIPEPTSRALNVEVAPAPVAV